jgi:hypothetical protein
MESGNTFGFAEGVFLCPFLAKWVFLALNIDNQNK